MIIIETWYILPCLLTKQSINVPAKKKKKTFSKVSVLRNELMHLLVN